MTTANVDLLGPVVALAVEWGLTVPEVTSLERRGELLGVAHVPALSESQWAKVAERVYAAAAAQAKDRCTACDAPVWWMPTTLGRNMPIDPLPHLAGNVEVLVDPATHRKRARVMGGSEPVEVWPRFRPHWATCPHGREFKRPRETARPAPRRRAASRPRRHPDRVEVRLPVMQATAVRVSRLREVLLEHPGKIPVRVVLTSVYPAANSRREVPLLLEEGLSVAPSPELLADLKVLVGPRSASVVWSDGEEAR